jgi:pentose-5-phosphate-3-epimerase
VSDGSSVVSVNRDLDKLHGLVHGVQNDLVSLIHVMPGTVSEQFLENALANIAEASGLVNKLLNEMETQ